MLTFRRVDARTWEMDLPGELQAFKKLRAAMKSNPWLRERDDGRYAPTYTHLVPIVDSDGALTGVQRPRVFRLKQQEQSDGPNTNSQPELEAVAIPGDG